MTAAVFWRRDGMRFGFMCAALLFIVLAVAGGVRGYSIVPYWDMWDGYLIFLDNAARDGWPAWWEQHNEHRIVLSRLFFWADLRWFAGAGWFLIAVNYILVALGAVLFCRILREVVLPQQSDTDKRALAAFVVICLFFWSQQENLTWGFQSQFILAQLLPLTALYVLYRSMQGGTVLFVLACLLGVLSAGTMANGILALPLMAVYAMLTRQGMRRIGVLLALAVLVILAYFHQYVPPAGHGSLSQALRERPESFVRYVLIYLGGPFNYAFGEGKTGKVMAQLAGLFFVASAIRFAWLNLRQPRQVALPLVLLFFIAYIGGTAIGTAGGRVLFGVDQALSHRYTTPALTAWCALLILYAPALLVLQGLRRRLVWGALAVLTLLMLVYQWQALKSRSDELFERAVGALAIELRIKDVAQIGNVFPSTDVIAFTEQNADLQRSLFGLYPYRGARAQMGKLVAPLALPACQGHLDTAMEFEGDNRFLRINGWLIEPARKLVPQVVRLLDAEGRQVGYALGGMRRDDVAAAVDKRARTAGYRGYLSSAQAGSTLTMRGEGPTGPFCQSQVQMPRIDSAQKN
jgi:hypothetical protein